MILSTVLRQRFGDLNAWCCAKKKGDRIYTPTARTRRIFLSVPRNYMARVPKERVRAKRLRAAVTVRYVAKMLTGSPTKGESMMLRESRQNFPHPEVHSEVRRYRDLPREIRVRGLKRIISRCRTETHTVPIVRGNLRRSPQRPFIPFVGSSLSGPFPWEPRCVLVASWRSARISGGQWHRDGQSRRNSIVALIRNVNGRRSVWEIGIIYLAFDASFWRILLSHFVQL